MVLKENILIFEDFKIFFRSRLHMQHVYKIRNRFTLLSKMFAMFLVIGKRYHTLYQKVKIRFPTDKMNDFKKNLKQI